MIFGCLCDCSDSSAAQRVLDEIRSPPIYRLSRSKIIGIHHPVLGVEERDVYVRQTTHKHEAPLVSTNDGLVRN